MELGKSTDKPQNGPHRHFTANYPNLSAFKAIIEIHGDISDIIKQFKGHLEVPVGESVNDFAFIFGFDVGKYNTFPLTQSPKATVHSKLFAFKIEKQQENYCISFNHVNPEDYHYKSIWKLLVEAKSRRNKFNQLDYKAKTLKI